MGFVGILAIQLYGIALVVVLFGGCWWGVDDLEG